MFETDNWYAVAGSDNLGPGAVIPATVNGTDLAVWRDSKGTLRAYSNYCIHRGMRLSHGFVRDDHLVCRYHGWRYQKEGRCDYIPALPETKPAAAHCLKNYQVGESQGLIWVSLGEPEKTLDELQKARADQDKAHFCRSIYVDNSPAEVLIILSTAMFPPIGGATGKPSGNFNVSGVTVLEEAGPLKRYCCEWQGAEGSINAEFVSRQLAPGLLAIHSNLDDLALILACQPVGDNKTGIHLSIEGKSISTLQRLQIARWATQLRFLLENAPCGRRPGRVRKNGMAVSEDRIARDQWFAIERSEAIGLAPLRRRLLGQDICASRDSSGAVTVSELDEEGRGIRSLPSIERYGHLWTSIGTPGTLFEVPEFEQDERRLITCGAITVHTSGPRIVENFLDLSHFPFVHTGILGEEPHTEVASYRIEFKEEEQELWAYDCQFYQPKAAASASGGVVSQYQFRVANPFVVMLYKSCPVRPGEHDVIGLFIQPVEEDCCDVHSFILVFDESNTDVDLLHFQQLIFLQDRSILENQVPKVIPLAPGQEIPSKADTSSIAYRKWLKRIGLKFGVQAESA